MPERKAIDALQRLTNEIDGYFYSLMQQKSDISLYIDEIIEHVGDSDVATRMLTVLKIRVEAL